MGSRILGQAPAAGVFAPAPEPKLSPDSDDDGFEDDIDDEVVAFEKFRAEEVFAQVVAEAEGVLSAAASSSAPASSSAAAAEAPVGGPSSSSSSIRPVVGLQAVVRELGAAPDGIIILLQRSRSPWACVFKPQRRMSLPLRSKRERLWR